MNKQTLRYYERRGLISAPVRTNGGHRRYDDDVTTLRVIKAAQRLVLTLDEVADLLELGRSRGRIHALQVRAQEKLAEVDQRMADLTAIRENLVAALDAGCDDPNQCATSACCPIPFVSLAEFGRTTQ